jgi:two-component system chemotaxis response regulator CheB
VRETNKIKQNKKIIVVGASAGGLNALTALLSPLPGDYGFPVLIVQHLSPLSDNYWLEKIGEACNLKIKEAEEKEVIKKGFVYVAPSNYHLLVERDNTLSLSVEEKVNFSRPSIDVLFETASDVFKQDVIGILLTGASQDGAAGMKKIKENGGVTIVQDPETAENRYMPESAIKVAKIDYILSLEEIVNLLIKLHLENL